MVERIGDFRSKLSNKIESQHSPISRNALKDILTILDKCNGDYQDMYIVLARMFREGKINLIKLRDAFSSLPDDIQQSILSGIEKINGDRKALIEELRNKAVKKIIHIFQEYEVPRNISLKTLLADELEVLNSKYFVGDLSGFLGNVMSLLPDNIQMHLTPLNISRQIFFKDIVPSDPPDDIKMHHAPLSISRQVFFKDIVPSDPQGISKIKRCNIPTGAFAYAMSGLESLNQADGLDIDLMAPPPPSIDDVSWGKWLRSVAQSVEGVDTAQSNYLPKREGAYESQSRLMKDREAKLASHSIDRNDADLTRFQRYWRKVQLEGRTRDVKFEYDKYPPKTT